MSGTKQTPWQGEYLRRAIVARRADPLAGCQGNPATGDDYPGYEHGRYQGPVMVHACPTCGLDTIIPVSWGCAMGLEVPSLETRTE